MAVSVLLTWVNNSAALVGQRVEYSINGGSTFNTAGEVAAAAREFTHEPNLDQTRDVHYRVVSQGAFNSEATSEVLIVQNVPGVGDVVAPTSLAGEVVVG